MAQYSGRAGVEVKPSRGWRRRPRRATRRALKAAHASGTSGGARSMDARRSAQSPTPLTVGIPLLDEEAILVSGPARSAAFPDALGLATGAFNVPQKAPYDCGHRVGLRLTGRRR